MKKYWPGLLLFLIIAIFYYPLWWQRKLIGPFDFLVNWYHPYKSLDWSWSSSLYSAYLQFKTYLMSDVVAVVLPLKYFAINSLKNWQIPLWNPYLLSGAPLLATTQAGVFNPFNLWFLLLGFKNGFNPYIVTQTILATGFMYLFLRSIKLEKVYAVLGAITYSLSGYFIVWLPWGTLGYAYLYLPLTLFLINRYTQTQRLGYFFGSALALALSFYSGHIQTTVSISLAIYFYCFFQKIKLKTIFLHGLTVFGLSAPQLLPTAQLMQLSARQLVTNNNFYQEQTSSLFQLLNNFAPDFFGNPVTRNWWGQNNYAETVSYTGTLFSVLLIINFIYLIFSKETVLKNKYWQFFNWLLLLGFLFSTRNPLSYWLFRLKLPLISSSTFSRYLSLFSFSQIILGLYTLRQLNKESWFGLVRATTLVIIWVTAIWFFTLFFLPQITGSENLVVAQHNLLLPTVITLVFLGFWWLKVYLLPCFKLRLLNKTTPVIFLTLVVLIQIVDLFRFGHKYLPFSPNIFFFPETALSTYAKKNLSQNRLYGNFDGNFSLLYNLNAITGQDPLYNLNYAQLLTSAKTGRPEVSDRGAVFLPEGPYTFKILNILGVRYLVDEYFYQRLYDQYKTKNAPDFTHTFPKIDKVGIYNIHLNPFATKQAYFIPQNNIEVLPEGQSTISRLLQTDFNPQQQAIVNQPIQWPSGQSQKQTQKTKVFIKQLNPQLWQIEGNVSQPGLLVINQTYFPQWQAFLNGKKVPVIKVNHTLQGVILKPGKHKVVLKYQDTAFIIGVWLFLATGLVYGYLAIKPK